MFIHVLCTVVQFINCSTEPSISGFKGKYVIQLITRKKTDAGDVFPTLQQHRTILNVKLPMLSVCLSVCAFHLLPLTWRYVTVQCGASGAPSETFRYYQVVFVPVVAVFRPIARTEQQPVQVSHLPP